MKTQVLILAMLLAVTALAFHAGESSRAAQVFFSGDTRYDMRTYPRNGSNYVVRFRYTTNHFFMPAVVGSQQTHYDALADIWVQNWTNTVEKLIGSNIPCQYTKEGCFEDSLETLLSKVNGQESSMIRVAAPVTYVTNDQQNLVVELKKVLNEIAPYVDMAQPLPDFTLVYRPPAMQLRYNADRIDETEAMKARFKALLEKVNKLP